MQKLMTGRQAYELSILTGTQVLLLIVSETGLVYTYATAKLQPLVKEEQGRELIKVKRHCRDLSKTIPLIPLTF